MLYQKTGLCSALIGLASLAVLASPARSDVIAHWNAKAETMAAEKRIPAVPNAHNTALLQVAVFEAVNAIERRYAPYKLNLVGEKNASKEAAAAAAAHAVLAAVFPDQKSLLDVALETSLATIPDGQPKASGVQLGKRTAAGLIALRANDGVNAPESYRPRTAPGVYVPTVIPVSSTFGAVIPWVMKSGSQFRPPPPPALNSETWTSDLNEIRELGGLASTKRTAEQTSIGRFWMVTGPQSWNPIVRQLVSLKELDIVESARLFALVAMACDDAYIAVFDAKYFYNFWRPVTAIRNADITGNPTTPRDATWLPLGDTPIHPEYPCAHCITSSAAAVILKSVFGSDIPELSITSPTAPGVIRKWTRIDDYPDEVARARIYAGFHYRFSNRIGADMGRNIGELTLKTQLRLPATSEFLER